MRRAATLLLLLAALTARAEDKPCGKVPERFDVASAVHILESAPGVWPDGMGFAAAPSCYAAAFRWLAKQQHAAEEFEKLAKEAGPAGRLYGLAGLKYLDARQFGDVATDSFFRSDREIQVIDGCVMHNVAVRELAADIRAGRLWRYGVS